MNDMKIITGKIKQEAYDEAVKINEVFEESGRSPMYDLSGATIDRGSIVDQFKHACRNNERKFKKGEEALYELIKAYGTQFPMELNGEKVVIRINGAVSK